MVNFIKNNTVKRKRGFRLFHYFFSFRHLSEQYFTSSQTFSHFFRHVNGRPQVMQILLGKSDFFFIFIVHEFIKTLTIPLSPASLVQSHLSQHLFHHFWAKYNWQFPKFHHKNQRGRWQKDLDESLLHNRVNHRPCIKCFLPKYPNQPTNPDKSLICSSHPNP